MFKSFDFCLPTRATTVPTTPDWLHEVKYDGYRLRVERNGDRVRLITRGGYDWTKRYPWIVEAALKNRQKQFVIDGEAVILGVDGISDFNALHSGRHNEEVQLCAFDVLARMAMICATCRYRCARQTWLGCWLAGPMGFSSTLSSSVRSDRTCSARRANSGWKVWSASTAIDHTAAAGKSTGSR